MDRMRPIETKSASQLVYIGDGGAIQGRNTGFESVKGADNTYQVGRLGR